MWGSPRRVEGKALTSTIYPGHLVEMTSAAADTYKLFATAGAKGEKMVAIEDDLQGNSVATAYTAANKMQVNIYKSGEECLVKVANGQNIAKGDKLVRAAAGYVQKAATDSSGTVVEQEVIGIAMEAKDMSDSSGADPAEDKIRMRWL
jgi:hypothetical protein